MTKLEKLYSIIENSREVGVKLSKDVLQQVEVLGFAACYQRDARTGRVSKKSLQLIDNP